MTDVVLLVKGLIFLVLESLEDFADFREMLNELLYESLLAEIRDLTLFGENAEVIKVRARLHQVDNWLHSLMLNRSE